LRFEQAGNFPFAQNAKIFLYVLSNREISRLLKMQKIIFHVLSKREISRLLKTQFFGSNFTL
jgi:hypothetical protein